MSRAPGPQGVCRGTAGGAEVAQAGPSCTRHAAPPSGQMVTGHRHDCCNWSRNWGGGIQKKRMGVGGSCESSPTHCSRDRSWIIRDITDVHVWPLYQKTFLTTTLNTANDDSGGLSTLLEGLTTSKFPSTFSQELPRGETSRGALGAL